MPVQAELIEEIAREVVARLRVQLQQGASANLAIGSTAPRDGVFATVDEAVNAAFEAQKKVAAMSLEERGRMVEIICRICRFFR